MLKNKKAVLGSLFADFIAVIFIVLILILFAISASFIKKIDFKEDELNANKNSKLANYNILEKKFIEAKNKVANKELDLIDCSKLIFFVGEVEYKYVSEWVSEKPVKTQQVLIYDNGWKIISDEDEQYVKDFAVSEHYDKNFRNLIDEIKDKDFEQGKNIILNNELGFREVKYDC